MKNFFVIANKSREEAVTAEKEIKEYLEAHGANCVVDDRVGGSRHEGFTKSDAVPKDTECVIVLGGDGTLLQASVDLMDVSAPFLGINLGTLGFLTAADKTEIPFALDRMLNDEYVMENRMMLEGYTMTDGETSNKTRALNEVVLTGSESMQMVFLDVFINDQFIHRYHADGLIVSTATGSTGYNLSAGGPIINPTAETIALTPICPHSLSNRSIILSKDDVVRIEIPFNQYGEKQDISACFDGNKRSALVSGNSIFISKSEKTTGIIKLKEQSFLQTINNKLRED